MRLIDIVAGIWVIVIGFDGSEKFHDKLLRHGLYPRDRLRILRAARLSDRCWLMSVVARWPWDGEWQMEYWWRRWNEICVDRSSKLLKKHTFQPGGWLLGGNRKFSRNNCDVY